jgi:hypothetical protein
LEITFSSIAAGQPSTRRYKALACTVASSNARINFQTPRVSGILQTRSRKRDEWRGQSGFVLNRYKRNKNSVGVKDFEQPCSSVAQSIYWIVEPVFLHCEIRRERQGLVHGLADDVTKDKRTVRDAPFAVALLEAVHVAR